MNDPVILISAIMFWSSVAYLTIVSVQALVDHLKNKGKDK